MSPQPVVVVGMHRSGTTLVARALDALGLFMGADVEVNHESQLFQRINECIFFLAGARWDQPEPVGPLLDRESMCEALAQDVREILASRAVVRYTGALPDVLRPSFPPSRAWGFKDPRTSWTLPLWLDVFPDLRVVHVVRNGIDVAKSLKARSERAFRTRATWIKPINVLSRWPTRELDASIRCSELMQAFGLWRVYLDRISCCLERLPGPRRMEVRFEDLLAEPYAALTALAQFTGVAASEENLRQMESGLRADRANAWRADEELRLLFSAVSSDTMMRRYGYSDEPLD